MGSNNKQQNSRENSSALTDKISIDFGNGQSIKIHSYKGRKRIDTGEVILKVEGDIVYVLQGNEKLEIGSKIYYISELSKLFIKGILQKENINVLKKTYVHSGDKEGTQRTIRQGESMLDASDIILVRGMKAANIDISEIAENVKLILERGKGIGGGNLILGAYALAKLKTDEGKQNLINLLMG